MAANFRVKIGEIGLFAFIRRPDIRKRIAILKCLSTMIWLHRVNIWWTSVQYLGERCTPLYPSSISSLTRSLYCLRGSVLSFLGRSA